MAALGSFNSSNNIDAEEYNSFYLLKNKNQNVLGLIVCINHKVKGHLKVYLIDSKIFMLNKFILSTFFMIRIKILWIQFGTLIVC